MGPTGSRVLSISVYKMYNSLETKPTIYGPDREGKWAVPEHFSVIMTF
jgi:hypothetical protein